VRLLPHVSNTSGFFIASLQKVRECPISRNGFSDELDDLGASCDDLSSFSHPRSCGNSSSPDSLARPSHVSGALWTHLSNKARRKVCSEISGMDGGNSTKVKAIVHINKQPFSEISCTEAERRVKEVFGIESHGRLWGSCRKNGTISGKTQGLPRKLYYMGEGPASVLSLSDILRFNVLSAGCHAFDLAFYKEPHPENASWAWQRRSVYKFVEKGASIFRNDEHLHGTRKVKMSVQELCLLLMQRSELLFVDFCSLQMQSWGAEDLRADATNRSTKEITPRINTCYPTLENATNGPLIGICQPENRWSRFWKNVCIPIWKTPMGVSVHLRESSKASLLELAIETLPISALTQLRDHVLLRNETFDPTHMLEVVNERLG